MSKRETKIRETDFEDFQDNTCDMSQPYSGCIEKIILTYPGRPDKVACYIVHPDDVGVLDELVNGVQPDKKSSGEKEKAPLKFEKRTWEPYP